MDESNGRYPDDGDYVMSEGDYDRAAAEDAGYALSIRGVDSDMLPTEYSEDAVDPPQDNSEPAQYADANPLGASTENVPAANEQEPTSPRAAGSFVTKAAIEPIEAEVPAPASDAPAETPPEPNSVAGTVRRYGPRATTFKIAPEHTKSVAEYQVRQRMLHQLNVAELRDVVGSFKRDMEYVAEALANPDIYQFKLYTAPPNNPEVRIPNVFGAYYGWQREKNRTDALGKIFESGVSYMQDPDRTFESSASAARKVLEGTYSQIANIRTVHSSPATYQGVDRLPGAKKMAVKAGLSELNRLPKPPELAGWMQQSMPRFIWEGQPLPVVDVPEEYRPRLEELWSGYTVKDADYLTSQQKLADGKAPYHKAMLAAETVAADGYADAAFDIKAAVIAQALDMEFAKTIPDDDNKVEMPIFNIILAGALTGQIAAPPRGAPYNYAGGVRDTVNEAWHRIPQETEAEQPGAGTAFIERIAIPPDGKVSEYATRYLAQSLINSTQAGGVDIVSVLRRVHEAEKPWAAPLIEHVAAMPNRPILTNEEAAAFATTSLPEAEAVQPEQISEALDHFSHDGDTDIYNFKVPLSAIAEIPHAVNATVHVDVEPESGSVLATINYKHNGTARQVPLRVDLASGDVSLTTLDDEPLALETANRFRTIIENAIVMHDTATQEAETVKTATNRPSTGMQYVPTNTTNTVQPERARPKIKTRGVPGEAEAEDIPEQPQERSTSSFKRTEPVHVIGAGIDGITEQIAARKVTGITPQQIALKIDYLLKRANESENGTFGKRTVTGDTVRGGDRVRLRQVNIVTGGDGAGRRQQIRLFFEEKPHSGLQLVSVYHKKNGENGEKTHIESLVKEINKKNQQSTKQ